MIAAGVKVGRSDGDEKKKKLFYDNKKKKGRSQESRRSQGSPHEIASWFTN